MVLDLRDDVNQDLFQAFQLSAESHLFFAIEAKDCLGSSRQSPVRSKLAVVALRALMLVNCVPSTVQADAQVVSLHRLIVSRQIFRVLPCVLLNVGNNLLILHAGARDESVWVLGCRCNLHGLLRSHRLNRWLRKILVRSILRAVHLRLLVCKLKRWLDLVFEIINLLTEAVRIDIDNVSVWSGAVMRSRGVTISGIKLIRFCLQASKLWFAAAITYNCFSMIFLFD